MFASDFKSEIPKAELFLEDQYDVLALKIAEAIYQNSQLFRDGDDPQICELQVNGVYPGLAVVQNKASGNFYAANWTMSESGDVTFSEVRPVSFYYQTLIKGNTTKLGTAMEAVFHSKMMPLQIEADFLSAGIVERNYTVPKITLDGARPVAEMEFVRYLRDGNVLTEAMSAGIILDEKIISHREVNGRYTQKHGRMFSGEGIPRLAMVRRRMSKMEQDYFAARLRLCRPMAGVPMYEKSTTLQSVILSKDAHSKDEAIAKAKRNNWGSSPTDENDTSYRFRQFDPAQCEDNSFRTIEMSKGVSGVICKRKGA